MNILIVGSPQRDQDADYWEQFISACEQLGVALAQARHTIIVGSSNEGTADCYVVQGAISVKEKYDYKVLVITPYKSDSFNPHPRNIHRYSRESWAVGRIDQITAADGVISLGGGQLTLEAGYGAMSLRRTILPLPHFDGSSKDLFERVEPIYERFKGSAVDLGCLHDQWDDMTAPKAVRLIETLIAKKPFGTERHVPIYVILPLLLILLSSWVWLFLQPVGSPTVTFFLLLAISALIGTIARNTQLLLNTQISNISREQLLVEVVVSLSLAFGLLLLHLGGEITITGQPDFSRLANPNEFRRAAVIMSILGLAAGFLIEKVSERLTKLLEAVIEK